MSEKNTKRPLKYHHSLSHHFEKRPHSSDVGKEFMKIVDLRVHASGYRFNFHTCTHRVWYVGEDDEETKILEEI